MTLTSPSRWPTMTWREAYLQNLAAGPTESSGHHSAAVAVTTAHSRSSGASWASQPSIGSLPIPPEAARMAKSTFTYMHIAAEAQKMTVYAKAGEEVVTRTHMSPGWPPAG